VLGHHAWQVEREGADESDPQAVRRFDRLFRLGCGRPGLPGAAAPRTEEYEDETECRSPPHHG
jgi:hypothetical protein